MSANKYLDEDGAILLNQLLATKFASKADTTSVPTKTSDLNNDSGYITKDVNNLTNYTTTTNMNLALANKLDTSLKGANSGLAELDANGKVPSSQLPAYVDDIVEGYYYNSKFYEDSSHTIEITGEAGKIYVDLDSEKTYRWGGSTYVEISPSLALGETSTTAYRGDRGKTAYDHATDANRLTTAQTSGFYKFASTAEGHIASVTAVAKSDLTGLGVEDASNKSTSISSSSTDTEYASAKSVYTYAPPKSHASTATTYGAGTTTKYGHCMTIDDLNLSTHANGKALSAHQGYVLDQGKQNKLTAGTNIDITSDVISTIGDTIKPLTEASYNIWALDDGLYQKTRNGKTFLYYNSNDEYQIMTNDHPILMVYTIDGKKNYILFYSDDLTLTKMEMFRGIADATNGTSIATFDDRYAGTEAFTGTNGSSAGTKGLVPAPTTSDGAKFLKGNGTWANIPNEIQTLTSNIVIWNINPGVYKIPASSTVYYMGATDQHNFSVSSTGYLFITELTLTKQFFILAGDATNRYLYNGYTTETTGQYKAFNIGSNYLTSISSYVKDNLTYSTSGTTYALSAYQGYVLDQGKENVSNKVTSLSSQSTDTQYPSAKLVYDQLALKMNSADMVALTNTEVNNIFDFVVANS